MRVAVLAGGLCLVVAASALEGAGCGGDAFLAGAGDAGNHPVDAGIDTGLAADTGAPPAEAGASWCAIQAVPTLFCEDFDEYASVNAALGGTVWPSFVQTKGSFEFDTKNPKSAPNSLQALGDDGVQVLIVHTLAGAANPKRMRLEFDLRVNSPGNVGFLAAAGFAAIAFGNTVNDGFAAIAIGNGPVISAAWVAPTMSPVTDAGPYKTENASAASFPALGIWANRYALEIQFEVGGTACIQVFEGPSALLTPCLPMPPELVRPGAISIAIGDQAAGLGNTGSVDLEFDNVTFDITR